MAAPGWAATTAAGRYTSPRPAARRPDRAVRLLHHLGLIRPLSERLDLIVRNHQVFPNHCDLMRLRALFVNEDDAIRTLR